MNDLHKNINDDDALDIEIHEFEVDDKTENHRLDKALSLLMPDLSRSMIKKIADQDLVFLNDAVVKSLSKPVKVGDKIAIHVPEAKPLERLIPQNIPLDIIYEDDDLLVINKQAGLVVHPGAGNPDGTLVNALLYHCGDSLSGIGGEVRPGIVHRLDKETSGLMLVAKNDKAHQSLSEQLQDRTVSRSYYALVWGNLSEKEGTLETRYGRSKTNRQKMTVLHDGGKEAITHFKVEKRFFNICDLVSCRLETGRTHQIRVHMTHLGHPLLGDKTYGQADEKSLRKKKLNFREETFYKEFTSILDSFDRQALHAYRLKFIHPISGKKMSFSVGLPDAMQHLCDVLSKNFGA